MKITLLKFTAFLLIVTGSFSSCREKEYNYPIDIPFTEYSLKETLCHWTNLNYDNKLIVINNNSELRNYINCSGGTYPEVDFSRHNLLLVSGRVGGVIKINTRFLQLSANEYKLDIEIIRGSWHPGLEEPWDLALIVKKMNQKDHIEINVTTIES